MGLHIQTYGELCKHLASLDVHPDARLYAYLGEEGLTIQAESSHGKTVTIISAPTLVISVGAPLEPRA